jgi:hypothetical protein
MTAEIGKPGANSVRSNRFVDRPSDLKFTQSYDSDPPRANQRNQERTWRRADRRAMRTVQAIRDELLIGGVALRPVRRGSRAGRAFTLVENGAWAVVGGV